MPDPHRWIRGALLGQAGPCSICAAVDASRFSVLLPICASRHKRRSNGVCGVVLFEPNRALSAGGFEAAAELVGLALGQRPDLNPEIGLLLAVGGSANDRVAPA